MVLVIRSCGLSLCPANCFARNGQGIFTSPPISHVFRYHCWYLLCVYKFQICLSDKNVWIAKRHCSVPFCTFWWLNGSGGLSFMSFWRTLRGQNSLCIFQKWLNSALYLPAYLSQSFCSYHNITMIFEIRENIENFELNILRKKLFLKIILGT